MKRVVFAGVKGQLHVRHRLPVLIQHNSAYHEPGKNEAPVDHQTDCCAADQKQRKCECDNRPGTQIHALILNGLRYHRNVSGSDFGRGGGRGPLPFRAKLMRETSRRLWDQYLPAVVIPSSRLGLCSRAAPRRGKNPPPQERRGGGFLCASDWRVEVVELKSRSATLQPRTRYTLSR